MVKAIEKKWKIPSILNGCKYVKVKILNNWSNVKKGEVICWKYVPKFEKVLFEEEEKGELKILGFFDKNEDILNVDIELLKKYDYSIQDVKVASGSKENKPIKKSPKEKEEKKPSKEDTAKEILKQEKKLQEIENYEEGKINWIDEDFWDSWDKVKGHMKNLMRHHDDYLGEEKLFFLSHSKNQIKGKPQLVEAVMRKLPLVRLCAKKVKDSNVEEGEKEIQKIFCFDERFDKRYDGYQADILAIDFWIYKVITPEGNEVFIWTQEKLPNCTCTFEGMMVEVDDFTELSRSLKVKSISKVFFMKRFDPDIKLLSKENLIKFTKEKELTLAEWNLLLQYHPNGNINLFDDEILSLRSAFILSGKRDGYPLHLAFMGNAGTKKSWGHLGTLDYKFSENSNIIGGGNTRAKALVPSFKEKPADIGYFARAERVGFIDEVCKMAEFELNKHQSVIQNLFGEWNDLLDNLKRRVGSGNNNGCEVEATCKNIFVSNPLSNRKKIENHVGVLDSSMMSRILWFVQDEAEQEFLRSSQSILRISPHTSLRTLQIPESSPHTYIIIYDIFRVIEKRKNDLLLGKCWGKVRREDFLSIFDSCNDFVCDLDDNQIQEIVGRTLNLAHEPMKSSVWKPRAEHHTYLLIDGLCKQRCLFKDYDATFSPKQEDYDLAEKILIRMIKSWETDLSPKENI